MKLSRLHVIQENKIKALIAQGHDPDIVQQAANVSSKHVVWFTKRFEQGYWDSEEDTFDDAILIADWATNHKINLDKYNWDQALEDAIKAEASTLSTGKPVHHFANGWYITQVPPDEVPVEGMVMQNCLRSDPYGNTPIYSLRDSNNHPHVTIAIHTDNIEVRGKQNQPPNKHYMTLVNQWLNGSRYSSDNTG